MKINLFLLTSLLLLSNLALSKVTKEEAYKLGKELTEIGATREGNTSGSIPAYDITTLPSEQEMLDENKLFVITSENYNDYIENLTEGQIALFKKFPKSYFLPVYKTHRTASYPKSVLDKSMKNSVVTELVRGGNGLEHFDETVPFAIPKNGVEVIWNHITRYRGGSVERNSALISVLEGGLFTPVKVQSQLTPPQHLNDQYDEVKDENVLFYYMSSIKSPARLTGAVLLVHETIDQVKQPRKSWVYNAGQRRVRRAPQVAYDAPSLGSEGQRTSDQVDMFNGAPNKYNWKLVGKREVYIPYNSSVLAKTSIKYDEILDDKHLDQENTRYELHRVWKVEATIKEDERHIYAKRTFYIDEDSWQIALADHYDSRGDLWRISEGHAYQFSDVSVPWYIAITNYDLFTGQYMAELHNEERNSFIFNKTMSRKDFTPAAIRRKGKR